MSKQTNNIETNKLAAIEAGRTLSAKIGDASTALANFVSAMDKLDKAWDTRTKADKSAEGLAVEAVRLDLQAREKERNAKNPDDAWSKAKAHKKAPKVAKYTGKAGAGVRSERRNDDEMMAAFILKYRAKVSANTVKDKGINLTSFQRDCAPLLAQFAELIAKHKIKVTKAK